MTECLLQNVRDLLVDIVRWKRMKRWLNDQDLLNRNFLAGAAIM